MFWDELASASPNLLKLDAIGKRFESAVKQAEKAYEELLRLNASSVTVLRRYALFLDEVWNDPGKSMKLTAQADEVDEATSKEHAEFGSSLVLFAKVSELLLREAALFTPALLSADRDLLWMLRVKMLL